MSYTVLIPGDIAEDGKQYLIDKGYKIKLMSGNSVQQIIEDVKDCDAILARTAHFPKEVIEAAPKLKVIAKHGVGCDNIDVEFATKKGIYVTFGPESNANSVAECAICLMMGVARHLLPAEKATRAVDWEFRARTLGMELQGKTLGLVGAGRIGTMVAKKAVYGFDMNVVVYDPFVKEIRGVPEAKVVTDMDTIFKEADFVSVHVPSTPETNGLVNKKHFNMMKRDAYFINVARGAIVNEADLYDALKSKRIAGAALDVFEPEPPARDNPLFSLDNVLLTPHIAASTKEAGVRMAVHAAIGIDEVLSGNTPKWPFNKPVGKV